MDVLAKLAALTSALGPYGHVRPGRAAETPGFAFYGAIGILVCDCVPGPWALPVNVQNGPKSKQAMKQASPQRRIYREAESSVVCGWSVSPLVSPDYD